MRTRLPRHRHPRTRFLLFARCMGRFDYHRADAMRILDFAHAAEYINEITNGPGAEVAGLVVIWLVWLTNQTSCNDDS